jgi:transposase
VCDGIGRPVALLLTEGQVSDHKGAAFLIDALPPAARLIADRGYDSDSYRRALRDLGIEPCIPSRKNRKEPIAYDAMLYRQRHKVENMFAKLKDWRRIAMRYDRCAHTFMAAIAIAATMLFWLRQ